MNWRDKDDLKMGPPGAAGALVAERDRLREELEDYAMANRELCLELNTQRKRIQLLEARLAKVKVKKKPK